MQDEGISMCTDSSVEMVSSLAGHEMGNVRFRRHAATIFCL
jgi:hypothetical protein